jgi:thioredoxin-dependent peroxiredoxin
MFPSRFRVFVLSGLLILLAVVGTNFADDKKVDLQVGDPAPVIEARTDEDKTWTSADHYGKKWVVVYFYPGDFTPGCTAQANAFRDAMHKLNEEGVAVVGVSGDSVATHKLFKSHHKLNFPLLADEKGEVAKAFGVAVNKGGKSPTINEKGEKAQADRGVTIARVTVVIGLDGNIAAIDTVGNAGGDAKRIEELVSKLEKK